MSTIPTLPSDRQLVGAVRGGSDAAWNELMGRHAGPVRAVARKRIARRALERGFASLRDVIEADDDLPEGDPAVRAFRPRALAAVSGGTYGPNPPTDDDGDPDSDGGDVAVRAFAADDDELLATAFARLPEPWQTVLWHSHVEQLTASEISPLVGRTANDVADLITTAERGLVDAFLIEYLDVGPLPDDTKRVVAMLGGHVRGTLPPRDQALVDAHFTSGTSVAPTNANAADGDVFAPPVARRHGPEQSRHLVGVISTLDDVLAPAIAPGVSGVSVEAHRRAIGTSARTLGTASFAQARTHRIRRYAVAGAVAALVLALAGAAYLIRQPFESDDTITTSSGSTAATQPSAPADPNPQDPDSTATTIEPVTESAVPVDDDDAAQPTTTVLDLRPTPSGPANGIEIIVNDGTRALGLRQATDSLSIEASTPAPVFAGGTGTIDLAITNAGPQAADVSLELLVPSGVVFEALAGGDAECSDPSDDSPFCNVSVAGGEELDVALRFRLESSVVGRLIVDGENIDESLEAPIVATRDLVHSSVGNGGVAMIGNSLMTCADDAAAALDINCANVRGGAGQVVNRWDVPMEFIGPAPQFGIENSSSATLDVPDGSAIVAAHLYWSGDLDERQQSIPDDGSNARVTLLAPDGAVSQIEADKLSLGDVDATQYLGSADVTDIVASGGLGEYLIGNVQSVEVQGSYAAWSMVVVYDDEASPRRHRVVTRPFNWIAPEPRFEYASDIPVPVVADGDASLSVLAFEGERGFIPESLTVGGEIVGGESVFDSTITGERSPSYDNNLGVDIDAYDLTIDTADGTLPIRATSEKDGIRIAVLALTVDLAE